MKTRVLFEVFTIGKGKTYNDRTLYAVLTDEVKAKDLAKEHRAQCSKIHAVLLEGKWHRYYVRPLHLNESLLAGFTIPDHDTNEVTPELGAETHPS